MGASPRGPCLGGENPNSKEEPHDPSNGARHVRACWLKNAPAKMSWDNKSPAKVECASGVEMFALGANSKIGQTQFAVLVANLDDGGILTNLEAANSHPAFVGDDFPFLASLERVIVDQRQAVFRQTGDGFELQIHFDSYWFRDIRRHNDRHNRPDIGITRFGEERIDALLLVFRH